MKIEQIEITGEGFSMLIDVEAVYTDTPEASGDGQTVYDRQVEEVIYPNADIALMVKSNENYLKQVMDQVWKHLDKFGD